MSICSDGARLLRAPSISGKRHGPWWRSARMQPLMPQMVQPTSLSVAWRVAAAEGSIDILREADAGGAAAEAPTGFRTKKEYYVYPESSASGRHQYAIGIYNPNGPGHTA